MSSELLPFSAFALESFAPAGAMAGESQTLTLKPALPTRTAFASMAGTAVANKAFASRAEVLRASVVPADGSELTITF